MKLYLTKEEIEEIDDFGEWWDAYIHVDKEWFNWQAFKMIIKANTEGYPFSIALRKMYVIEAMYNGGVLIRPYDSAIDYALQSIE